jgi:hypothetical protein
MNRISSFPPRPFRRLHHHTIVRRLSGANNLQVRVFLNEDDNVNEDDKLRDLNRKNIQQYEILRGWKEKGTTRDGVGCVADLDEFFSRDFLRGVQVCDGIDGLLYKKHHCWGGSIERRAVTVVPAQPTTAAKAIHFSSSSMTNKTSNTGVTGHFATIIEWIN